jgi:outer membrane receptor protein involved in Fe transport
VYDFEINAIYKPTKHLDIISGLYRREAIKAKLVVDAPNLSDNYVNLDAGLNRNNRKATNALFTEINYRFNGKINLIAGLRLEQSPKYNIDYAVRFDPNNYYDYYAIQGTYLNDKVNVIPRFAIIYHIKHNHTLKLLYGKAIKQPSIGENMDVPRYPDRPQLKPAEMQTIELNYISVLSSKAIINFSFFRNDVNKLLSRTNTMENGEMKLYNTNSGKLSTNGVELDLKLAPDNKLDINLSVTYQESKNLKKGFDDIALGYAPNFLGYGSISYQLRHNINLNFAGRYVDEMESYWKISESSFDPKDGGRISVKIPSYFVSDLNLRFDDLFSKGIFVNLNVTNLFDNEIRYPTTTSNDIFDKGTIGRGRSFLATAGWKF